MFFVFRKVMMKNKICILTIVLGLTAVLTLHAEDVRDKFNPVMTAVTSQSIAPDARGASLGDVGVATEADVNSQAWNPAKYPFTISRAGLSLNYTPWLRQLTDGIALLNATGYVRLGDYQALSASLRYFTLGDVSVLDDENMTVKPFEMSVDLAYSRMLSESFSMAVALRYMYSDMSGHYYDDMTAGNAFAADIACYWNKYLMMGQRECLFNLGANISNIGSKINYGSDYSYFIPTKLQFGLGLTIPLNEYNKLSFTVEASKLLVPSMPLQGEDETSEEYEERIRKDYYDMSSITGIFKSFSDNERGFKGELSEIRYGIGAEYTYNDKFSLRAGYHHESEWEGNRKYFTCGAGFRMNILAIDAAYTIATSASNPLDQTLRVGLSFDFDGISELIGKKKRR